MDLNGWRRVWLFVLFDLPVKTKTDRRHYRLFHKALLKDGFHRVQFSVYNRFCPSVENAEVHEKRVKEELPPEGEVRLVLLTDKQFERMKVYWGEKKREPQPLPPQLLLF
ncbi:MAG: CRISPR-associated endonuclease Cas2 [Planctomycetes bacterium]|nr:CRISPR-associated endonuclease Cas2 [Planctomycetota bacterium]